MPRYLVAADQTLGGERLLDEVRSRARQGPTSIHVVVPASDDDPEPGVNAGVAGGGIPSTLPAADPGVADTDRSGDARRVAFNRLKEATARFEELGDVEVDGEVGPPDPLDAIEQALESRGPFDEILLSTPPATVSKWIAMDVASRAERRFGVPVVHVEEEPTEGDLE